MDAFEIGKEPLATLAVADPELAAEIAERLAGKGVATGSLEVRTLVKASLTAMSQEVSFGRAVAKGGADLAGDDNTEKRHQYWRMVRDAGSKGPTLGRILATYLVPVLKYGDDRLLIHFQETVDILCRMGTYTLKDPLEVMARLLSEKDREATGHYLGLLCDAFSQKISYNQSQHLALELPGTVRQMAPGKRCWQIPQMRRVVRCDVRLVGAFIQGFSRGLDILSKTALERFVSLGLEKAKRSRGLGRRFLALESRTGLDALSQMQVTAAFSQVQFQLNRYVQARISNGVTVRPLSMLPKCQLTGAEDGPWACSDGRFIYLPDEIGRYGTQADNITLYKILTRLEAGLFEYGTFDFDMEKISKGAHLNDFSKGPPFKIEDTRSFIDSDISDLACFLGLFSHRRLAADLFTIFEHGRLRLRTAREYPGLDREAMGLLTREASQLAAATLAVSPVQRLYGAIALGTPRNTAADRARPEEAASLGLVIRRFNDAMAKDPDVETSAVLTAGSYDQMASLLERHFSDHPPGDGYTPMSQVPCFH